MSKARRLEEILEECVSAHLEGRRSLEQSLSLYPALRSELEPLLRTALGLRSTFQATGPSPAAQQRGLARFLSDARARRNLKTFRRQIPPSWLARFFAPKYRMGLGTLATGLAITAVAIGMASVGGGANERAVAVVTTPPVATDAPQTPAAVSNVASRLDRIRNTPPGQIKADDIRELDEAIDALSDPTTYDVADVESVLQAADDLLGDIKQQEEVPPEVAAAVDDADETNRDVAGGYGIDLNATPSPVPTDAPTPVPTDAPTPVPTEVPTEEPTQEPTAAPPTDTPITTESDDRVLPGNGPQ